MLERLLGCVLIVFCLVPQLTSMGIVLAALFIGYGYIRKELIFRWNHMGWWMVALYAAYLIGTLWTKNEALAFKYLEYKLAFVALPLLLSFRSVKRPLNINVLFFAWIGGVTIASIVGIVNSVMCSSAGGVNCFFAGFISPIHHPSYFAAFHLFAMGIAWWGYTKNRKGFKGWWVILFTLFSMTMHLFFLSLAGMLFLIVTMIIAFLYVIFKRWGKMAFGIAIITMPIVIVLAFTKIPSLESEWTSAKFYLDEYLKNPEEFVKGRKGKFAGSEARLVMWTVAGKELGESPFGVGTANSEEVLEERLIAMGHEAFAKEKLNPHNQFLQTGVEIGWLGMFLLVGIIFSSVYLGMKYRNWLLVLLACNLAFNCLFESMLQRQSGIVFYMFWIMILGSMEFLESKKKEVPSPAP